jgi:hypothetical protein
LRASRKAAAAAERRRIAGILEWAQCLAPPKTHGRRREARRWIEVVTARITNGLPRERRPGQRHIMPSEGNRIWEDANAALAERDPSLFAAVRELVWEDNLSDLGLTLEEWKVRALKRARRIGRVRATLPVWQIGTGTGLY